MDPNSNDKLRQMQDEMSRFEAEISGVSKIIGANTFNQVQQRLQQNDNVQINQIFASSPAGAALLGLVPTPVMGKVPPPPPPPPILLPSQIMTATPMARTPQVAPTPPQIYQPPVLVGRPTVRSVPATPTAPVVTATPKLYTSKAAEPEKVAPSMSAATSQMLNLPILNSEVEKKLKKLKEKNMTVAAEVAISQGKASSALQSFKHRIEYSSHSHTSNTGSVTYGSNGKKTKKIKKAIRTAGGTTWEDSTLQEWDEDDFRLFCGDLGNDVTDELLTRTFNRYPSFVKARVVRDKRTNKTKGYGFVSFKDPQDFIKATKEMNGRYVGSRPIKLRKSCWKNRNLDVVRKKDKEKAALLNMLTTNAGV